MARRVTDPNQEAMFEFTAATGVEHLRVSDTELAPDPNPGPYVNLAERAELISKSSIVLGKISSRMAYKDLMEGPLGDYVKIMQEEQDDLVPLDEKVKVATLRAELRFHFEAMFGLDSLVESGEFGIHWPMDVAAKNYGEYVATFGNSKTREAREAYRKQIRRNARNYR